MVDNCWSGNRRCRHSTVSSGAVSYDLLQEHSAFAPVCLISLPAAERYSWFGSICFGGSARGLACQLVEVAMVQTQEAK